MFLVDTNVLAELRKGARFNAQVVAWNARHSPSVMFVSVLTLGEIRKGVELLRARDLAQAVVLDAWFGRVCDAFAGRILPIDAAVADAWGRLNVPQPLPAIDGLLAATALTHGLTRVTRNVADFARARVPLLNPFDGE
jgi:toxin FitB